MIHITNYILQFMIYIKKSKNIIKINKPKTHNIYYIKLYLCILFYVILKHILNIKKKDLI